MTWRRPLMLALAVAAALLVTLVGVRVAAQSGSSAPDELPPLVVPTASTSTTPSPSPSAGDDDDDDDDERYERITPTPRDADDDDDRDDDRRGRDERDDD